MTYTVVPELGRDLTADEVAACMVAIEEGGALEHLEKAKEELLHAIAVAILRCDGKVVGVGAIKRARPDYAKGVAGADKSAFPFDPQMNELGYVAILKAHQGGRSGGIMNSLLERYNGPLWATTSEKLMKTSLSHRGFEQKGDEWPSRTHPENMLSLWIKSK